jgi:hypothetical protein
MGIAGLEWLSGRGIGVEAARLIYIVCVAHFLFWYGLHVFDTGEIAQMAMPYETWDSINHGNPERRIAMARQLEQVPGDLLVFVRYSPQHMFQEEWVWNAADIDQARVVWARDLGPEEDRKLIDYFPRRTALVLEPDARPMKLSRWGE